jgi:phytoene dehydrogenase-like protein
MIPSARRNSHRSNDSSSKAVVVGAGPNGLAAAVVLARSGWSVTVREAADAPGGGVRSGALTLPGFVHDLGSAVHPMAVSSPVFRTMPLAAHGLAWIQPPVPLAHAADGEPAILLHRSVDETAAGLDRSDARRYRALVTPFASRWDALCEDILGPLRVPRHPVLMARFGPLAMLPAAAVARCGFAGARARALFAGLAAHGMLPLTAAGTTAFALVFAASGHAVGWPVARGGSGALTDALVAYLASLGGRVETNAVVRSLDEVSADAVVLDLTPRQVIAIAGDRLPPSDRRALRRFRYGPGAFKVDWALSEPIPWRDPSCALSATVHIGASLDEMIRSEAAPWRGAHAARPWVLLAQPSLFDPSRAPPGRHTAWAYCHVPNGSHRDMLDAIESQIERVAPGFRDVVLARSVMPPSRLEAYDANLVGGDVGGGANSLSQLLFRPTVRWNPYRTGIAGVYLGSASTPPGGGVHGMCGYHAAQTVLAGDAVRYAPVR